ncbi:MAG: alanine racemase [Opitutae bacterium]
MRPPPQARCWADIDLATLERNLRRIKAGLPQGVQYVAVVKADAYGHGIQPVVSRLMQCGADMFAVANVAEGAQIREIGSGWPILVLSPVLPGEEEALLEYELIATLSTQEEAQRFNQFAKQSGSTLPVHIKIDTGMGRAGIWHEEAFTLLETVQTFEHLRVDGLYTHFADAPNNSEFTEQQRQLFLKTTANFRHNYSERTQPLLIHADSSSSLESTGRNSPVNAVRVGLLQFGVPPSEESVLAKVKTEPVLTFSTQVGLTKKLPSGTGISYGQTYTLKRESTIAVLTAGYGDGIPLASSNKAYVLINGQKCKILGRVTMDQTIVDVTKVAQVKPGKIATLIGTNGNASISLTQYADFSNSIPYESLCSITKRVQRVYKFTE